MIYNNNIKVYRWLSKQEKKVYVFNVDENYKRNKIIEDRNDDPDAPAARGLVKNPLIVRPDKNEIVINEIIFKDDSYKDALDKIAAFIANTENIENFNYYAWKTSEPILFKIKKVFWKGYHINPFFSNDHNSDELNESIQYDYNLQKLFNLTSFNIVFIKDLPSQLKNNRYYLINLKQHKYNHYKKHNDRLIQLSKLNSSNVKKLDDYYTRVSFQGKLKGINLLSELFDSLHTSNYINMIQWIDDSSKILYKLYKKHNIKDRLFKNWINIDLISEENILNIYSIIKKSNQGSFGSYCKITIDSNSNIFLNYYLESRSNIEWDTIEKNKKTIVNILQNYFKQKIYIKSVSLNTKSDIEIYNSSMDLLRQKLSKEIDIFTLNKNTSKTSISCTFKRSSNYTRNTDIYDYIKTRIELGLNKDDIVKDLLELGIEDVYNIINDTINIMNNEEVINKRDIKIENDGTFLTINKYNSGYNISVSNCVNNDELKCLYFWLEKIISTTFYVDKLQNKGNVQNKISLSSSSSSSSSSNSKNMKDDNSSQKSSKTNESLNSIDIEFEGGAKKDGQILNKLKQADPDLFKNYARTCQKKVQPVVFNKEQKKEYERNDQLKHFDNYIEYGSKNTIKNYYACPKLWCPISNIPLSIEDPNPKCPGQNEEPMMMVWDKDNKTKKRYVSLVKSKEDEMKVPCCSVKKPIEDKKEVKDNTESYIKTESAPIPIGRYGNIPEYLHNILFYGKDIKPEQCKTTLNKSFSCFVRKGIEKNEYESAILSIIYLLDFQNKDEFVSYIKKHLDLLTFISLENGFICKQFMEINTDTNLDYKLLQSSLKDFSKTNLFNIKSVSEISKLIIYNSYLKFIDYISSNDYVTQKNPQYIYSLIHRLFNVNILICEKDESDQIYIHCPSSQYEINEDFDQIVALVMKDGKYYEPIEMKMRNMNPIKTFKLNEYPMLEKIISKCSVNEYNESYNNLYMLHNWINSDILTKKTDFQMKHIYINDDLTIDKILLKCNMMLKFDKLGTSILPKLIKNFNLKNENIVFYGDYIDKVLDIKIYHQEDLLKFIEKCDEYNIMRDVGMADNELELKFKIKLTRDKMKMSFAPILHSNSHKELVETVNDNKMKYKKWFDLNKMVIKTILKKYSDHALKSLYKKPRQERINELMQLFQKYPDKNNILIILEEIPIKSTHILKIWLSKYVIFNKYDIYNENIINDSKSKEFIFSQSALIKNGKRNIPDILLSYHKSLPNNRNIVDKVLDNIDISQKIQIEEPNLRPDIFKGNYESLGTKWVKNKNKIWKQMKYINNTGYNENTIPSFFNWLKKEIRMSNTKYETILQSGKNKILNVINDLDCMEEIFDDPYLFNAIRVKLNKTYKNLQGFMNIYKDVPNDIRYKCFEEILEKDNNVLFANDLHILSISELLNINILLIHRKKYNKTVNISSDEHKEYNDVVNSSTLFPSKTNMKERPLVILQKRTNNAKFTIYDIVLQQDASELIYKKLSEVPEDIQNLVYILYNNKNCNDCAC